MLRVKDTIECAFFVGGLARLWPGHPEIGIGPQKSSLEDESEDEGHVWGLLCTKVAWCGTPVFAVSLAFCSFLGLEIRNLGAT